jgi:hypothetical protein
MKEKIRHIIKDKNNGKKIKIKPRERKINKNKITPWNSQVVN